MNLVKIKDQFFNGVKANGFPDTAYDYSYRSINRLTKLMVLKCMTIEAADPGFLKSVNGYVCEFLDREKLMELSKNQAYDLGRKFLDEALGKGDECFAILDGDRLASYGWYSNMPTRINDGLEFHFNDRYIYMYNGFTHPDYRGQRLHAIGMTMALNQYLKRGYKGIVSWVEANNFNSLRSCYRMGYRDIGEIYVIRLFRRPLIFCSGASPDYGLKVLAIH